jgi:hypothetical protein
MVVERNLSVCGRTGKRREDAGCRVQGYEAQCTRIAACIVLQTRKQRGSRSPFGSAGMPRVHAITRFAARNLLKRCGRAYRDALSTAQTTDKRMARMEGDSSHSRWLIPARLPMLGRVRFR